jgi:hypothetical protein
MNFSRSRDLFAMNIFLFSALGRASYFSYFNLDIYLYSNDVVIHNLE